MKPGDIDTGQLSSDNEADVDNGGHWLTTGCCPASINVSIYYYLCYYLYFW